MQKIVNFLKKWASGKIVLSFFIAAMAVYLTMLLYTLPAVERFAPGKALFDLSPVGYSYEYAFALLEALGPEGRSIYLHLQLPLDFIYPGLFAISCSLLLTWVFNKGYMPDSRMFYFSIMPFVAGFFDYLENIGIVQMINAYPHISVGLVGVSSTFTLLKSGLTVIVFVLLLLGAFKAIKKRFSIDSFHR